MYMRYPQKLSEVPGRGLEKKVQKCFENPIFTGRYCRKKDLVFIAITTTPLLFCFCFLTLGCGQRSKDYIGEQNFFLIVLPSLRIIHYTFVVLRFDDQGHPDS